MLSLFQDNKPIFISSFLISFSLLFILNYETKSFLEQYKSPEYMEKHSDHFNKLSLLNNDYIVLFNIIEITKIRISLSKETGVKIPSIRHLYTLLFLTVFFLPLLLPMSFLVIRPWLANIIQNSKFTDEFDGLKREKISYLIAELIFSFACFAIFYGFFEFSI